MKTRRQLLLISTAILLGVQAKIYAQGAAFTYQGRLNSGGLPANGSYDLQFTLFNTNATGSILAGPATNSAVSVTNGVFTTLVNFGPGIFTGTSNWLQIAVSTNAANAFSTLSPRQQVTPTPYAISAEAVSGGVNASQLAGGTVPASVLAGFQGPSYVTVSGGNGNTATSTYGTVGGGSGNTAGNTYATVGGGNNNNAYGQYATAGGGSGNAAGYYGSVGGGNGNTASGQGATVPGGYFNTASGYYSFAAGDQAQAANQGAFVWADSQGTAFASTNNNSFNVRAGGGAVFATSGAGMKVDGAPVLTIASAPLGITLQQNTNGGPNVIEGSPANVIGPGVTGSVVGGGGATNYYGLGAVPNGIGAGSDFSTVAGGEANVIYNNSYNSVISGGGYNTVPSGNPYSSVGGGYGNQASNTCSTVSGGNGNQASGYCSTVPGGYGNIAAGPTSFAAGYGAQTSWGGTFIWADNEAGTFNAGGPNQFLIRASGGVGVGTASPQANVDITSSTGITQPQLRLAQQNGNDYSRLRYQTGTLPNWDVSVGGANDQMNWYVPNYGNVMTLQTNGALATGGLTVNNNGAIHVSGAGLNTQTAAFVQVATTNNIANAIFTVIDNPLCNGNPNAILIVTPAYSPTVGYQSHPVGVGYGFGPGGNKWSIINLDSASMQVGSYYNVLVILP